jgi:hypothetical protein
MVVEGDQQSAFRSEWKGLPDKLERTTCVGREGQDVLARAGVEIAQDRPTGSFEMLGHCRRCWVVGVRIAENTRAQKTHVLFELRFSEERAAGVIQAAVFGGAQSVN